MAPMASFFEMRVKSLLESVSGAHCLQPISPFSVQHSMQTQLAALQVLRLLVRLYKSVAKPDWLSISQCLAFLDDAAEVAKLLDELLKGSEVCSVQFLLIA